MEIDWKRKLTSRKFWATVCNFIGMLILAMGGKQETAVQITEIIMAGAGVVAYIIAEGLVDAANVVVPVIEEEIPPDEDIEDDEEAEG